MKFCGLPENDQWKNPLIIGGKSGYYTGSGFKKIPGHNKVNTKFVHEDVMIQNKCDVLFMRR